LSLGIALPIDKSNILQVSYRCQREFSYFFQIVQDFSGGHVVDSKIQFGPRLKELRIAAGLSRNQLAEKTGGVVLVRTVEALEQGRNYPSWPAVLALAAALGVTPDAFTVPPTSAEPQGRGRPPKESLTETPRDVSSSSETVRDQPAGKGTTPDKASKAKRKGKT
jgi:transcriptional regulator with XRE-family HTH domain